MGSEQLSYDTEQLEDDVQMAIKNIEWAKEAASSGDTQKTNNHLHRARELLEPYTDA
ncbi:MAG: hypothetical protein V5A55_03980 [Halovenus sp.]